MAHILLEKTTNEEVSQQFIVGELFRTGFPDVPAGQIPVVITADGLEGDEKIYLEELSGEDWREIDFSKNLPRIIINEPGVYRVRKDATFSPSGVYMHTKFDP